ncbi:TraR/DksA family transcriptional regulator [Pseudomonas protegens]|uniref:TraR/DksA C4-type zinc finger protein n=1 Tax=Pseudomonas TaxID=286 RepID=UPI000F46E5FB|nr:MULTISPECIES: TraR/DksA C4-type zinc finger protein [Pseudomonas]MCS4261105.1 phage/conjugal plasmid C-4 type zinc finger TraR family protein [Pseudomonas sp. BIGb0176]QEN46587.1 transcriptional regulator [Pseudomonas protegens]ROQ61331.1 TraR/DksA family transcriptional regulator [Pseudomonas protegens]ROQ83649.1 TraR/DksA family transcriptional regulator [Pseudomonas protegens]
MADDIDRANDQAQYLLDVAIHRNRVFPSNRVSAQFCEDCGEPIPLLRQQAIEGCETCILCQGWRERNG